MSWCISALSKGVKKLWSPVINQVRFRYHQEKIDAGPLIRRYGYKDKIHQRGMLPHMKHEDALPMPAYRPKNAWSEKRATFGQNDYIDIFSGKVHPTKILYNVPMWLRGAAGNEYQILLRRRRMLQHGEFPKTDPTKWNHINKRIGYLYRYLNRKTRTWHIYGSKVKP